MSLPNNGQAAAPVFAAPDGARSLWAPEALLNGQWQTQVLLSISPEGRWSDIQVGVAVPPAGAQVLGAPVVAGMVNAHSHAFQRAFVGQAERRDHGQDDFWSWRDRMYQVALGMSPQALETVATTLYRELLAGGYTQVCEFHYLQHREDGQPYEDELTMAWSLQRAAQTAGIGLTLMPVMYERAGFDAPGLRPDQRRFRMGASDVHAAWRRLDAFAAAHRQTRGASPFAAGVAIHSLRAATPEGMAQLMHDLRDQHLPIHIHVAEQTAEVDDCVAHTGQRPIEWLIHRGWLDQRWHLVHATHTVPAEIDGVARAGAGAVICPTTEANLGDGWCDWPAWMRSGVPLTIGSDSHVSRSWIEELRCLEYGQRLLRRQRNVSADPDGGEPSTGMRLWRLMQGGGAAACGEASWGLSVGARADLLVLPMGNAVGAHDAVLTQAPVAARMDALVFGSSHPPFDQVMVQGRWVRGSTAAPTDCQDPQI